MRARRQPEREPQASSRAGTRAAREVAAEHRAERPQARPPRARRASAGGRAWPDGSGAGRHQPGPDERAHEIEREAAPRPLAEHEPRTEHGDERLHLLQHDRRHESPSTNACVKRIVATAEEPAPITTAATRAASRHARRRRARRHEKRQRDQRRARVLAEDDRRDAVDCASGRGPGVGAPESGRDGDEQSRPGAGPQPRQHCRSVSAARQSTGRREPATVTNRALSRRLRSRRRVAARPARSRGRPACGTACPRSAGTASGCARTAPFSSSAAGPLDLEVAIGVVVVPDADRDPRVGSQVAPLRAGVGRVEDDVLAVGVDPHDARLRAAVAVDGRDDAEVPPLEELQAARPRAPPSATSRSSGSS